MTLVALIIFAGSLIVFVQDLTGAFWKHNIPLTADLVQKQEGGAYRFPLNRLGNPFPERLRACGLVLENGSPLTRVRSRSELFGFSRGAYTWTNAYLWVAPQSSDFEGLVARIPDVISVRTRLILFGAILLSILGIAVSPLERKLWHRSILECLGAAKERANQLRETTMRQFSSHQLLFDLSAVALLILVAGALYFPLVDRGTHSQDGFLMSYLLETGDLLPYNVKEVKEPGRPLVGLGWHISAVLGGGSVSGYFTFMFSCLLVSAILVYAIVRTILPEQPLWALLASSFKLVWVANLEIFDNSGLAIYFVESVFWLAVFLFARLIIQRKHSLMITLIGMVGFVSCVVIVVGTYQTSWPLLMLMPLVFVGLGVVKWKSRRTLILLSAWYLSAISMMIWCATLSYSYAAHISPSLYEIFKRVAIGFWEATGKTFLYTIAPASHLTFGVSSFVILSVVVFAGLLGWFGLRSLPEPMRNSRRRSVRTLFLMMVAATLIIVGSLLPPSVNYLPQFGTRHMHWASIGAIMATLTALAALFRMKVPLSSFMSVILALVVFSAMICRVHNVGISRAERSLPGRLFWEDLIVELPKVKEATVVLMGSPPKHVSMVDSFGTWIFRAFTDTKKTFFVCEGKPELHQETQTYEITSVVDFDSVGDSAVPLGGNSYFSNPIFPKVFKEPQVFHVPASRVVWLSWGNSGHRLRVDPERSAVERINRDTRSVFGEKLFPRETAEKN